MEVFIDYIGELNWLAVIAAGVFAFMAGAFWYADGLFGKQWKKEVGLTEKKIKNANMASVMGTSFISIIVAAVAVGVLVQVLVLETFLQGATFGIMVAVGLLGANKFMQAKFEQKSMNYWLITLGADVLSFGIMGAVLAVWQ